MAAVTALYHLKKKEGAQNQSIERISSGLRLNHALDDAAGASIVGRMTSQIKGLEAAMRNAADAISLTQTAEGALDEVSSILHRMRELSVQAANGVYSGQDRQAIQNEVGQIQIELSRIAQNSTFNAVKMLNGDFSPGEAVVRIKTDMTLPNPALRVFPAIIRLTETLKLELSETITGDLPPNSNVTGTKFSDAALMTCLAIDVAPVKRR